LISIVVVLGLAILIPYIHHHRLRMAVEACIAELKAKGEPMDLAQVIPPPVPPEQNGVPFVTNALANLKYESVAGSNPPPAMCAISPGKAMIGWQQPDIRSYGRYGTNTWEDLGRELDAARSDLDSFQSLTNHPILDFNLNYSRGASVLLPHLSNLKRSAQWLSASALYDLHQGNPKNACADVRAILALVKGETDERPTSSQLIRIAVTAIGVNATWEILQNPNVSDDDLAQLQQDWQSLEFTRPLERTFEFERFSALQQFRQTRISSEEFDKLWGVFYAPNAPGKPELDHFGEPIRRTLFLRRYDEFRWRWFWSYEDELYELQSFQVVLNATRMVETNKSFQPAQSFASSNLVSVQIPSYARLNPRILIHIGGIKDYGLTAFRQAVRIETAQNVVVAAIALKRYELRHHKIPVTLEELTPDLLKAVPIDCMNGQPLRYRPNADETFLLYSVGENDKDDGGNPSLEKSVTSVRFNWQNSHALDWVWPQPATPEEIQKYYEEQAKKSK
jgi:hypothetical protein